MGHLLGHHGDHSHQHENNQRLCNEKRHPTFKLKEDDPSQDIYTDILAFQLYSQRITIPGKFDRRKDLQ